MAELATLERILKEKDKIEFYLSLMEKGDMETLKYLLEKELASLQKAIEAK